MKRINCRHWRLAIPARWCQMRSFGGIVGVLCTGLLLSLAANTVAQTGGSISTSSDPPIPLDSTPTVLPDYIGAPAKAWPLPNSRVPQNPYLWLDPYGYPHNNSWNSDTTDIAYPLGHTPETFSSTLGGSVANYGAMAGSVGFDGRGRLVVSSVSAAGARMLLLDPVSLQVLCDYPIGGAGTGSLGSAYFFMDNRNRIVVIDGSHNITTLREGGTESSPTLESVPGEQYDLSQIVLEDDSLAGVLVDWQGRFWFQTAGLTASGPRVGVINRARWPDVRWVQLGSGEQISNGMAVTKDGTYVLTSQKLYRFYAGPDDQPHVVWAAPYDTSDAVKPGQLSLGSGTSPTILGNGDYVAINDSATPMKIWVYRTAERLGPKENRVVGEPMPVFENMEGQACANSLLGFDRSIVVENNYGYAWTFDQNGTPITTGNLPGFERIDIAPDGRTLRKVWVNHEVASNVLPKLSTRTGLIYVVARKQDDQTGVDVYYWTALDFRTGKTVWQKMAGTGVAFDGYWQTSAIGPTGTAYLPVYGGLIAIRDTR